MATVTLAAACAAAAMAASSLGELTEHTAGITSNPQSIIAGPGGALWFTESDGIVGRITTAGRVREYPTRLKGSLGAITVGHDRALWFGVDPAAPDQPLAIARITSTGKVSEYPIGTPHSRSPSRIRPGDLTAGPGGAIWFTERSNIPDIGGGQIARIIPAGRIREFYSGYTLTPYSLALGSDGALWFTETDSGYRSGYRRFHSGYRPPLIGRITSAGAVREFAVPHATGLGAITAGPDGALWFIEQRTDQQSYSVGRITTSGRVTSYATHASTYADAIAFGPDCALWITETNAPAPSRVGRLTLHGRFSELPAGSQNELNGITAGPDNAIWAAGDTILPNYQIAPGGSITRITAGSAKACPRARVHPHQP